MIIPASRQIRTSIPKIHLILGSRGYLAGRISSLVLSDSLITRACAQMRQMRLGWPTGIWLFDGPCTWWNFPMSAHQTSLQHEPSPLIPQFSDSTSDSNFNSGPYLI